MSLWNVYRRVLFPTRLFSFSSDTSFVKCSIYYISKNHSLLNYERVFSKSLDAAEKYSDLVSVNTQSFYKMWGK